MNFYLNGKKVANSLAHYCNYVAVHASFCPKVIMLFYPNQPINQSIVETLIEYTQIQYNYVKYVQLAPWVYRQKRTSNYLISLAIGICISSISLIIWCGNIQENIQQLLKNKNPAFDNHYNSIMATLSSICYRGNCISKLIIFPQNFGVQIKDNNQEVILKLDEIGCKKLTERRFLCSKKKLFSD